MRRRVFCLWLIGGAGALAGRVTVADDWPCWRGPERSGISREEGWSQTWGAGGPPVLWRGSVGTGFSSFAVADGRAFTMGNAGGTDTVVCMESSSGRVLWRHSYPCEPQPLSYEGGPSSTPAVGAGRVFSFSKSGDLFCLDAKDGHVIWSRKYDLWPWREGDWKNTWRYAGSPLVDGDRLILCLGEAGTALSVKDGKTLWGSPAGHPGYSSPVPYGEGDKAAFAFFSGRSLIGVERASGKRLWEIPWRTEWDMNAADPIVWAERLFVSSGNGKGCALFDLSLLPPKTLWQNKHLKTPMNGAVLWQGHLYGFNDSELVCVEWASGERKWAEPSLRRGSVVVAGGWLLALSESGKLAVAQASADAFRPIAQAQILGGRCWTAPVLSGKRLFARNAHGDVVCLDLRKER